MNDNGIVHYSTYSKIKCAHAERVIRTLKNMLFKELHLRGSYNYLNVLPSVVDNYNHKKHRTIKMAPSEVNKGNEKFILENIYHKLKPFDSIKRHKREVLKKGDFVRISKERTVFEKGYIPAWSTEVFKIVDVKRTNPITYVLEDLEGQPILGAFYNEELMGTKCNNSYLIEKIIRKSNGKVLVKWLGFSKPTWINESDLVDNKDI